MPMWGGYWGAPWAGFGWIFPLAGLLVMVVMAFMCLRMVGRRMGGCMSSHHGDAADEIEALRTEVRELRDEIRKLYKQS